MTNGIYGFSINICKKTRRGGDPALLDSPILDISTITSGFERAFTTSRVMSCQSLFSDWLLPKRGTSRTRPIGTEY